MPASSLSKDFAEPRLRFPRNAGQILQITRQLGGHIVRRKGRISRLVLLVLLLSLYLQFLLAYMLCFDGRLLPAPLQQAKSVLLVTSHPDDECLFFAPSVLGTLASSDEIRGNLLVLSSGNNYGKGEIRKQELRGSCAAMGIEPSRCEVLNHPQLQDDPRKWWDPKVIQAVVKQHIQDWKVDVVITFDKGGVSGHINHRAVSAALRELVETEKDAPAVYQLVTTGVLRKYISLFDLPLTSIPYSWRMIRAFFFPTRRAHESFASKGLIVSTWGQYMRTREAFASHASQYSWDRHIYMILSRYVWFNTLERVKTGAA